MWTECEYCNRQFHAKRRSAVYCSTRCRVAAHRLRQPTSCPYCGNLFPPRFDEDGERLRYCNNNCEWDADRRAERQWRSRIGW